MKLACFFKKVKQTLTGRGCQNHATVQRFKRLLYEGKNRSRKISAIRKKDLSISCLFVKARRFWSKEARSYGSLKLGASPTK